MRTRENEGQLCTAKDCRRMCHGRCTGREGEVKKEGEETKAGLEAVANKNVACSRVAFSTSNAAARAGRAEPKIERARRCQPRAGQPAREQRLCRVSSASAKRWSVVVRGVGESVMKRCWESESVREGLLLACPAACRPRAPRRPRKPRRCTSLHGPPAISTPIGVPSCDAALSIAKTAARPYRARLTPQQRRPRRPTTDVKPARRE